MKSAQRGLATRSVGLTIAAASVSLLLAGAYPAAAVTIDDFTTAQSQLSAPPRTSSNVAGGMIGGRRDLDVETLVGPGPVMVEVSGSQLLFSVSDTTPDSRGRSTVSWDGGTDPDNLDPAGLGGIDLTAGDHSGFRLAVDAAGAGAEVVIEVFTDGGNASRAALVLPVVATATTFDLSYSTFVPSLGAGADFTNVGAVTLGVTSVEQAVSLAMFETTGPAIVLGDALKVDTLVVDNDGDGRVDPGDTLRYTITVTNTGAEATSVSLEDVIHPNLAVVADSLYTDPIAVPDTYLACGNLLLAVDDSPALPGLTANDHDPDGEAFSVSTTFPVTTVRGGTVNIVDPGVGSFDYAPPAGFRGIDSFSYEILDASLRTGTATVTLIVNETVWFVDSGAAGGGSGTQALPFNHLADAETASGPGDTIFVFAGAGDTGDGIVLKDDQRLIGEGVGLTACGTQVIAPGSRPTLVNATSTVVTLADGNRVAGLDIEPEGAEEAIVGFAIDGLDVAEVGIDTSRGGAGNGGVNLTNTTGTMTFDQLSITGTGVGTAFAVAAGNPQITVTSSSLTPAGGSLMSISGMTGGFVDFQATTSLTLAGGVGDAVSLQNNGATITLADLGSLTTGSGGGLLIADSGTVNLGSLSAVTATGGPALEISATTVASLGGGLTFASLSSTGSPTRGVSIDGVAPTITVSGTTTVASSTGDGIVLSGTNGAVTFASVDVNATGGAGLMVSDNVAAVTVSGGTIQGTVDAVALTNASLITLASTTMTNNSDSAITGSTVTNLVLNSVTVNTSGDALGDNSIDLTNLRGSANAITDSSFTASPTAERAVRIENTVGSAGSPDLLNISGSSFHNTYASPVGADLLEIKLSGTAELSATITGSTFTESRTNGVQMLVEGASVGGLSISGSTFTDQGIGIDMGVADSGSLTFDVSNNPTITARPAFGSTMVNLFTHDTAAAVGRVNDNPNIRCGGADTSGIGIRFNVNGASTATVEASNNTISDIGWDIGIDAVARGGSGRLDATITNNTLTVDVFSWCDIRTRAQDSNTVCANVANNTASGAAVFSDAYIQRTSDAGSTVLLQGFDSNATTTWNNNGNTPTGSVTSINNGTLGGGTCNTVP